MPPNQLSLALGGATALVGAAGPQGSFLLGNAADMPLSEAWLTFSGWAETYGEYLHFHLMLKVIFKAIVHLDILGTHIVVLNDLEWAADMLEKKSKIYSNRPNLVMCGSLVGWDQGPALIQFGQRWSQYRRLIAQFLGTRLRVETSYNNVLEESTHSFLKNLLHTPNLWKEHGYRFAGANVLKVAFGYEAGDENDPLVSLGDAAMEQFSEMTNAGAFAVDTFPFRTTSTFCMTPVSMRTRTRLSQSDSSRHRRMRRRRTRGISFFGYGRRVCPGIHLADASMWLLFASILAFCDISAPMKDGRPVLPAGKHANGAISHPEPFECTITPRKGAEQCSVFF